MLIDVERPTRRLTDAIAVYDGEKWKLMGKSAYLQPYMARNEATEKKFEKLREEFDSLKADFDKLRKEYADLLENVERMKESINAKLWEYHDVLRVLADEQ